MQRLYHISKGKFIGILGALGVAFIVIFTIIINKSNIYFDKNSNFANTVEATQKLEVQKPKNIKILVLGDMMFDRGVRSKINTSGFAEIFGPATTTFAKYDLVVANLEGPISTYKSKTILDTNKSIPGFQFTFATGTAKALKNAGIDMVSLANNHTDNFGQEGLRQTRQLLDEAGVQYFGSPQNIDQNNSGISTSTCLQAQNIGTQDDTNTNIPNTKSHANNICVGFIGWHEFGSKNHQEILKEIVRLRPLVDYLVVFPHWGEEYKKTPHIEQVRLARVWTDAGADAIIGAHPHVIQQITRRTTADGRIAPIFYSIGNFIFDQYFSFDTTHGIAVEIEFPQIQKTQQVLGSGSSTFSTSSIPQSAVTQSEVAQSAQYKIIPFSSVGSKVSIPSASSSARIFGDIEKVSGTTTWSWLKK